MPNIMFVCLGIHEMNLADAGSLAWYATDWLRVHGSLINRLIIHTLFIQIAVSSHSLLITLRI
jgi:hypothetical protein